jgi:anti-sigma regulatory factor (Ser/Thr protein kinase)
MAGPDHATWFRIDHESVIGAARRAAARLAQQIALPESRAGEIAIAVSEVAGNLYRHADDGTLLVRILRVDNRAGIGVVAADRGPGMIDALASRRDGHSTAGTLGIGLGAIERLASWSDVASVPGAGTVLALELWDGSAPSRPPAACLTRPMTGEEICGDAIAIRKVDGRVVLLAVDGLGHGPLAARAADTAVRAFEDEPFTSAATAISSLHRALESTRGAAIAVADIDVDGVVRYAGIGNIAGWIVDGEGGRRGLLSMPGIAGHQIRRVREVEYEVPVPSRVVMHSDGLTSKWTVNPALLRRDPILGAAVLLRDAGTRRDDASVVVAEAPCTL